MNPIISIIIPCYNHGMYIQDALDSIDNAKGSYAVEVIIVNDGSTDQDTIEKLKELEKRGYFVLNQLNIGLANARNNGIKLAKGKYILPLDSDNKVLKSYLNEAIDIFEKNEFLDIIYGNALYFEGKDGDWIVGEYNLFELVSCNYIDACAIYRKSVWEKIGGYDEKMPAMGAEDWDFWINASFAGFRFYYFKENCFNYRVLNNSMIHTLSNNNRKLITEYIQDKYKKYTDLPGLESYYLKKFSKNTSFLIQNISKKEALKILLSNAFFKIKKYLTIKNRNKCQIK